MAIKGTLDEIAEEVARMLIEDSDASEGPAQEAATRITQEDVDAHDSIDDLADYIYETEEYWN